LIRFYFIFVSESITMRNRIIFETKNVVIPPGWIWQPGLARFRYDRDAVSAVASQARLEQGVLLARRLPSERRVAADPADVWAEEAVSTAASKVIARPGGRTLVGSAPTGNLVDVRCRCASQRRSAVGCNEDATADWTTDLSDERLCRWQAALFPVASPRFAPIGRPLPPHAERDADCVGPVGKETVHYEAPAAARWQRDAQVLAWFNDTRAKPPADGIVAPGFRTSGSSPSIRSKTAMDG